MTHPRSCLLLASTPSTATATTTPATTTTTALRAPTTTSSTIPTTSPTGAPTTTATTTPPRIPPLVLPQLVLSCLLQHLVRQTQVLDRVAPDVDLRHPGELVGVFRSTYDLRGCVDAVCYTVRACARGIREDDPTGVDLLINSTCLFQVHVHPRIALDQVAVVRFSALQFNQLQYRLREMREMARRVRLGERERERERDGREKAKACDTGKDERGTYNRVALPASE